jgi:hypothetical protein
VEQQKANKQQKARQGDQSSGTNNDLLRIKHYLDKVLSKSDNIPSEVRTPLNEARRATWAHIVQQEEALMKT